MGLTAGWKPLQDNVSLQGIVSGHSYNLDGDWQINVQPLDGFTNLLTNSRGRTNSSGVIECEIEPTDKFGSKRNELKDFGSLVGKKVTVTGAWVEDEQHDNRTEIHPITSILVDPDQPGRTKEIEFFTFSDDSANFPFRVPFSGKNRLGSFSVPFPLATEEGFIPKYNVVSELNRAKSTNFEIVSYGSQYYLQGNVESGTAPNKGFYHGFIDLDFEAPSLEQRRYNGIWAPASDGRPIVWGYTLEDFQKVNGTYYSQGYKLTEQQSYDIGGGERRYDGIWTPASDGRPVVWGYTLEDFQKVNGTYYSQGYKLTEQQSYDIGGGERRYDGIWTPASDGRPVVWGYTFEDFQKVNGTYYSQGYKLTEQQSYDIGGGERRYDGIWTPASDGRPVVWGYTFEDFQKANGTYYSQGYKLTEQQSYDIGGGERRYDGIWTPASDGRPVVWGYTFEDFQKANGTYYSQGYKLIEQQSYYVSG